MQGFKMDPKSQNFVGIVVQMTMFSVLLFVQSCSKEKSSDSERGAEQVDLLEDFQTPTFREMIVAPGLQNKKVIKPLEDAWRRIDPKKDGWDSEVLSESATKKLKDMAIILRSPKKFKNSNINQFADSEYKGTSLRPEVLEQYFNNKKFAVFRGTPNIGEVPLNAALDGLVSIFDDSAEIEVELKLYRINLLKDRFSAQVLVHISGTVKEQQIQINSEWNTFWTLSEEDPKLLGIEALSFEEVRRLGKISEKLFADVTGSVFGDESAYRDQFLRSTDHWRSRLARDFGLDVVANHGMALGDVNGDGLDDLYICQQGGLPNRLFIRSPDGSLKDITAESNTGWIDYCASALILDFDNDGDRDLVISQDFKILFMDNLGDAKFELALGLGTHAQTFSITASDYDNDGDLDLFLCGYNPPAGYEGESGVMGEPMPYHDARNGGKNKLLRNDGNWNFTEVTEEVGLNQNNDRFSFAASWEDYDRDGDTDLYVANDYGRNNLYQNNAGKFIDVSQKLGVQDMSAGMSVSWGDYNRDGLFDLYVSNMFSSAGNRITYQRQFKSDAESVQVEGFRRHARGNSLFEGVSGNPFKDVSETTNVTMGRWAWGSRFADIDNDGWLDLLVANGFITSPDPGDL
ncbi:MAG: VCBS repeat-containing protein [Verrucomicrobiaceae bacterium]|nr:MAG: VCBS repeat-containing protein [Verrucomicrobiaceae bacterium]